MQTRHASCAVLLTAFALSLLGIRPAFAQSTEMFRSWNQPVEPFRIIGNVYYVGANEIASYLITTSEGHILMDGGFEETVSIITDGIQKLGFQPEDVRILLGSHAHFDHCGGLAELKRLTGARLLYMKGDVETLRSGGADLGEGFEFPAVDVDEVFEDGDVVELGGTRLVAHLTPGHTRGNTTWTLSVTDAGQDYNVVIVGSPNVIPEMPLVGNENYPGIADDFRHTFDVLAKLPCDVFLGSHASYFRLDAKLQTWQEDPDTNPFIDPAGYRRFVERKREVFERELARQMEAVPAAPR